MCVHVYEAQLAYTVAEELPVVSVVSELQRAVELRFSLHSHTHTHGMRA